VTENKIVPFGKYKGQPVERMMADSGYMQWLMAQDWFRTNNLYQVIINYGAEPQETPEHNALQVLFLDEKYCENFLYQATPDLAKKVQRTIKTVEEEQRGKFAFPDPVSYREEKFKAAGLRYNPWRPTNFGPDQRLKTYEELAAANEEYDRSAELRNKCDSEYEDKKREFLDMRSRITFHVEETSWDITSTFEVGRPPVDVLLDCVCHATIRMTVPDGLRYPSRSWTQGCYYTKVALELKPSVSDDYPSILRQMKASGATILVTRDYTGQGATRDQFVQLFKTADISVVFLNEIS
jgi:hypothetical protein